MCYGVITKETFDILALGIHEQRHAYVKKDYTQNIRLCFNKDISFFNNIHKYTYKQTAMYKGNFEMFLLSSKMW